MVELSVLQSGIYPKKGLQMHLLQSGGATNANFW